MELKVLKLNYNGQIDVKEVEQKLLQEESVSDCSIYQDESGVYLKYCVKNKYDEYGAMVSIINFLYDNFDIDAEMLDDGEDDIEVVDKPVYESEPDYESEQESEPDYESEQEGFEEIEDEEKKEKKQKINKIIELGASLLIFIIGLILAKVSGAKKIAPYVQVVAFAIAGYEVVFNGIAKIFKGKVFTEEFLMLLASFSAILLGHIAEAVGIMFLYSIGEFFSEVASDSVEKSLNNLKDLTPNEVNLINENGNVEKIKYDQIKVGDILLVKAGERIVIDGVIKKGSSSVDTKAVNGEGLPKDLSVGDEVYGGYLCIDGTLEIEATNDYQNSTLNKISEIIEDSALKKSKKQGIMEKFAKWFTPAIVIISVLLAFIPPIFYEEYIDGLNVWGVRAIMLLCISCPCAVLVSVPLTYFCGIGSMAKLGVLIKSHLTLEILSECKTFVFDKTGTLTKGELKIDKILSTKKYSNSVLNYLAIAEKYSNHPIALAVIKSCASEQTGSDYKEFAGKGVSCIYEGKEILAGNERFMAENGIKVAQIDGVGTKLYLAVEKEFAGAILLNDTIKNTAKGAILELYDAGVLDTVMLTGDNKENAIKIRKELKMKKSVSELTPENKVLELEKIINDESSGGVAFVGDGINDAPSLTRADVGIAMGGIGSDIAIECADVVVLDDDLSKIPYSVFLAKRTNNIAKQNIILSLAIKFLVLLLSVLGISDSLWLAIGADVGVLILTVLNAIRNKTKLY